MDRDADDATEVERYATFAGMAIVLVWLVRIRLCDRFPHSPNDPLGGGWLNGLPISGMGGPRTRIGLDDMCLPDVDDRTGMAER